MLTNWAARGWGSRERTRIAVRRLLLARCIMRSVLDRWWFILVVPALVSGQTFTATQPSGAVPNSSFLSLTDKSFVTGPKATVGLTVQHPAAHVHVWPQMESSGSQSVHPKRLGNRRSGEAIRAHRPVHITHRCNTASRERAFSTAAPDGDRTGSRFR